MTNFWISIVLCGLTYLGLATGKWPRLKTDRAAIAVIGATALVAAGCLSLKQAIDAIDLETIILLFGMMVVVAYLRLSGFFERMTFWTFNRVTDPVVALAITIALSGVLSAFLVNDIICLAFTPLLIHVCARLKFNPLPFLIGLATAANIGSAGTIIGNPQNMIIGSLSQISYSRFAFKLVPPSALGLLIDFGLIAFIYRGKLRSEKSFIAHRKSRIPLLGSRLLGSIFKIVSFAVITAVILLFSGIQVALVAIGAASFLLLVLGRIRPERIYREVDWGLLVMFAGLFVVVSAFELHVVRSWNPQNWEFLKSSPIGLLTLVSAGLSNLVSNVPAVLLFKPLIPLVPEISRENAWLALALSSTYAGNLTLIGSVANLIVVESARRHGVVVGFLDYLKVGLPVTLATLAIGYVWLTYIQY